MISKITTLATLALIGSLGVAAAQNASVGTVQPKATPPITAQSHSAATHGGRVATGGSAVTTGWHYFHATNCAGYYDGSTTWVYVFPSEGGYWYSSNSVFQGIYENQCSVGNWTAVY